MSVILDRPDLREKEQDAFAALPQDLQTEILQLHHAGVLKKRSVSPNTKSTIINCVPAR